MCLYHPIFLLQLCMREDSLAATQFLLSLDCEMIAIIRARAWNLSLEFCHGLRTSRVVFINHITAFYLLS